LRAEELRQRRIHQRRRPIVDPGDDGGGVYRNGAGGIVEDIAAETGVGLKFEEAARPQTELLRVDIERVIQIAPETAAGAAAAAHIDLRGQQQIEVEHDALLGELIS
jgi:hypothetical protein